MGKNDAIGTLALSGVCLFWSPQRQAVATELYILTAVVMTSVTTAVYRTLQYFLVQFLFIFLFLFI